MYKYLYGKKCHLSDLINGKSGFRYSDLSHYARMENELMKDNEMKKTFLIDKNSGELKINNKILDPESISGDIELSLDTRHCYCLCLSNRKNSDELYEKFKADVCVEVNVEKLELFLKDLFTKKFQGMEVIGRDITYYSKYDLPKTYDPTDLVFYKPDAFLHESEYRIALFYPLEKHTFETADGDLIPTFKENKSQHMFINYKDSEFMRQFIGDVYEATVS